MNTMKGHLAVTILSIWSCFGVIMAGPKLPAEDTDAVEKMAEDKHAALHKIDSLNLMLYAFLLTLTVLTIWFFKHKHIPFVHETGVTMVFGLIIGAIIRFGKWSRQPVSNYIVVPDVGQKNLSQLNNLPPDTVHLKFPFQYGNTSVFSYSFSGGASDDSFEEKTTFDPEIFFNVLLPPIIFYAGYSLKRKHFFRNIGTILMFAILGTALNCLIVGGFMYGVTRAISVKFEFSQCLFFGALIAATDPVTVLAVFTDLGVDVDLFAQIFGESALNDAVAIVMARTIDQYMPSGADGMSSSFDTSAFFSSVGSFLGVFTGSLLLGSTVGCLTALITKFTRIREFPTLETALFFLMSYLSFLACEASGMTGIVAILFCGVCQAHYTYNNLSQESQQRTKQFFELLNFLAENFVFTYIGVSAFTSEAHSWNLVFIIGAFCAILVGRVSFVYPFSFLLNLGRTPKIPVKHMHMMLFAGLRGAMAFALAISNTSTEQRKIIYSATTLIVIATVIFNGGFCVQVIKWLKIKHSGESGDEHELAPTYPAPLADELLGESSATPVRQYNPWDKAFLPRKWYNFDARYMKPFLTNARPTLMETLPQCCLPLGRWLTTTEQMSEVRDYHSQGQSNLDLIADLDVGAVSIGSPRGNSFSQSQSIGEFGDLGLTLSTKTS